MLYSVGIASSFCHLFLQILNDLKCHTAVRLPNVSLVFAAEEPTRADRAYRNQDSNGNGHGYGHGSARVRTSADSESA
jgi:hypothetical protein